MIAWFARHQTAANLLMAAIMILGLASLPGLQRETLPEVANDEVEVRVVYRGATPDEVEDAVCRRIEDALEAVNDLDELRCAATEGQGVAVAVMREGAEMMRFLDDVNAEVEAIDDFPDETERPVVRELGRTDPVIAVAVTGPDDPVALKAYAEDLEARMLAETEIAQIDIQGFSDHHIRLEIPSWRLRQYGLSAAEVAEVVARHSVGTPLGWIEGPDEDLLLRFDDQRKRAADFADLVVVSGASGAQIRLGEIATITDRFDRPEDQVHFDGRRAALLVVSKTRDQDVLDIYETVRAFVAAERERAPAGVALALTQDVASMVGDRLEMLVRNGLQGLALVFLVLWLFFGIRYSFWVTMGLPVSFLGAFVLMPLFGITVNMISMVGLLIGIGLLMDDAIVIAENIAARLVRGAAPAEAAIAGAREVLPGVLASFATTTLVFGSLVFIGGDLGQILRIMPVVLLLVISVSLIEAFWILPHHLNHALARERGRPLSRLRRGVERGFAWLRDGVFGPLVDRALAWRYLTLGLALMLLLVSVAMVAGGRLKFVGFPELDGDVIEARVLLPQGTPLARTEAVVSELEAALGRAAARVMVGQSDDGPLVRHIAVLFGQNPDAYEGGAHVARVVVDLLEAERRAFPLDDLLAAWREETGPLADVINIKYTEPAIGPAGRAIDIRLLGADLDRLRAASTEFQGWLLGHAGVLDLGDDLRPGKRELRLRLKPGADVLGLDARAVAEQVRAAFQGVEIDEFQVGRERYEVNLRVVAADRMGLDDLDDFMVIGPDGVLVPLSLVAEVEEVRGWARIHRIDGRRAVTIQGEVDRELVNARELLTLAQGEFVPGLRAHYPEVQVEFHGEIRESRLTGQSIVGNVALGLIGVYMLLALQFRGYLAPLTVMVVIPMALVGVVFGHLVLGIDLAMPSMIGMASLFGVVVNDSILLVVFIRAARARGAAVVEAAAEAARSRLRPILLTSITTIAGLTPLLLEKSLQAQILIPLATSLAFGLTTATLAALLLVPALYAILDDLGWLGALGAERD
ncbi:efflux RND transporter permease subunit [Marichromatium bheemlicum]|uniref:Efflux RND transporter permease subunit n=1 Tax=Marichromatium bheemlicum TaxID=365339 RepID=A0ABX1I671_9GAMM|nr:efflux RND transporter permease subunit [Marichromatium bheemlicum]NKN31900.1 efflux RND transporter permease subunit [Marichromatium bheemlicum]